MKDIVSKGGLNGTTKRFPLDLDSKKSYPNEIGTILEFDGPFGSFFFCLNEILTYCAVNEIEMEIVNIKGSEKPKPKERVFTIIKSVEYKPNLPPDDSISPKSEKIDSLSSKSGKIQKTIVPNQRTDINETIITGNFFEKFKKALKKELYINSEKDPRRIFLEYFGKLLQLFYFINFFFIFFFFIYV